MGYEWTSTEIAQKSCTKLGQQAQFSVLICLQIVMCKPKSIFCCLCRETEEIYSKKCMSVATETPWICTLFHNLLNLCPTANDKALSEANSSCQKVLQTREWFSVPKHPNSSQHVRPLVIVPSESRHKVPPRRLFPPSSTRVCFRVSTSAIEFFLLTQAFGKRFLAKS